MQQIEPVQKLHLFSEVIFILLAAFFVLIDDRVEYKQALLDQAQLFKVTVVFYREATVRLRSGK